MTKLPLSKLSLVITAFALGLGACGGGGSSSSLVATTPGTPVSGDPVWTPGVFANESTFKDQCAIPRTGTNPQTGNSYPDQPGSTTLENFWLRSWSNRTYLWYNEITDLNPADYANRIEYFDLLKTTRTTASGNPVDKFHFNIPTEEYQQSVSSGASVGYGARFRLIQSSPPREIVVAYTESGSPADMAGLVRGDKILEIDGEDAVNGSNTTILNNGLFPNSDGETHTFTVQSVGSSTTRSVTLNSAIVTSAPVRDTQVLTQPDGSKIGYVLFNTFGTSIAEEALFNAFTILQNEPVTDLVLDLRYNGGGFLDISSELAYMIAGNAATNGRIFETLVFNDKHPTINPVTGAALTPTPFHTTGQGFSVSEGTSLPTLNLPRVFILSSGGTCSARESLLTSLQGINVEVVLIGTTTCGKPYGFYATDNCGETYFTIQFRGENDAGFGDYSDGFSPFETAATVGEPVTGCMIADDFSNPLGDSNEGLLSAALHYVNNGLCPASMSAEKADIAFAQNASDMSEFSLLNDPRIKRRQLLSNVRIFNHPDKDHD